MRYVPPPSETCGSARCHVVYVTQTLRLASRPLEPWCCAALEVAAAARLKMMERPRLLEGLSHSRASAKTLRPAREGGGGAWASRLAASCGKRGAVDGLRLYPRTVWTSTVSMIRASPRPVRVRKLGATTVRRERFAQAWSSRATCTAHTDEIWYQDPCILVGIVKIGLIVVTVVVIIFCKSVIRVTPGVRHVKSRRSVDSELWSFSHYPT
jgi:hypothetical protein